MRYLDRENDLGHLGDLVRDTVDVRSVFDYQGTHRAAAHLQGGRTVVVGMVPERAPSVIARDGVFVWK